MPTKKESTQRHSAGNCPHDKAGCIHLLEIPTGPRTLENESLKASGIQDDPPLFPDWQFRNGHRRGERHFEAFENAHVVVFDLETQLSAAEVGGWNKTSLMRVSCGVAWDSREDRFITYFEDQIDELIGLLRRADLVVGFNVIGFDYRVLRGYSRYDFRKLKTLDILREVHAHLNYRVSLDSLAAATFNAVKTGDGLQALHWWKQGRLDLIEEYCRQDVQLTRDLFRHGHDKGFLLFDSKNGDRMRVPVSWRDQVKAEAEGPGVQRERGTLLSHYAQGLGHVARGQGTQPPGKNPSPVKPSAP